MSPVDDNAISFVATDTPIKTRLVRLEVLAGDATKARYSMNRDPRVHGNTETTVRVEADQQERYESFILEVGQKKVEEVPETRVPNASMFTFNKEDHTLGNLLRAKLAKTDHVTFAAYQVPHPLFATFKLRVVTDGQISPKDAVLSACRDLVNELQQLDQEFTKEWELKKIAGAGGD